MTLEEQIARIIDPETWRLCDDAIKAYGQQIDFNCVAKLAAPSLVKAQQAIAIVREEAAKVAGAQPTQSEAVAALWKLGSAS